MRENNKIYNEIKNASELMCVLNSIAFERLITFTPANDSLEECQFALPDSGIDIKMPDSFAKDFTKYLTNFVKVGGGIAVRVYTKPRDKVFGIACVDDKILLLPKETTRRCFTTCSDCGAIIPDDGSDYIDYMEIMDLFSHNKKEESTNNNISINAADYVPHEIKQYWEGMRPLYQITIRINGAFKLRMGYTSEEQARADIINLVKELLHDNGIDIYSCTNKDGLEIYGYRCKLTPKCGKRRWFDKKGYTTREEAIRAAFEKFKNIETE